MAEVGRHAYFQLPVIYRTDKITHIVLLIRWVDDGEDQT